MRFNVIFLKGNTSLRDCGGVCNGTANTSKCGTCVPQGGTDPFLDCNNKCSNEGDGGATLDSCNVCTGGSTGLIADYLKDECGMSNDSIFAMIHTPRVT